MSSTNNRFTLRELTHADHETLDAKVGAFDSVSSYRRYLAGMASFRTVVEDALDDAERAGTGEWRHAPIANLLKQDLADLGVSEEIYRPEFALPRTGAGLTGVHYVLEGSALGARLLVKRAAALGFDASNGARHLAAQTNAPANWPAFQAVLERLDPDEMEDAAMAARSTFQTALDAFSKVDDRERAG